MASSLAELFSPPRAQIGAPIFPGGDPLGQAVAAIRSAASVPIFDPDMFYANRIASIRRKVMREMNEANLSPDDGDAFYSAVGRRLMQLGDAQGSMEVFGQLQAWRAQQAANAALAEELAAQREKVDIARTEAVTNRLRLLAQAEGKTLFERIRNKPESEWTQWDRDYMARYTAMGRGADRTMFQQLDAEYQDAKDAYTANPTLDHAIDVAMRSISREAAIGEGTAAGRERRKEDIRNMAAAAMSFRATAERLSSRMLAEPDLNTVFATGSRFAENFMANANSIARAMGREIKETNPERYSAIRKLGIANQQLKGAALGLALTYAAVMGLGSGRDLSDSDVTRALEQIGMKNASYPVFAAALDEANQQILDRLAGRLASYTGELHVAESPIFENSTLTNAEILRLIRMLEPHLKE
jgi:hypothetical protein